MARNDFYNKIKNISLMGGITEPLIINNTLNISPDEESMKQGF